jgi:hypothetical protein
LSDGFVAVYVIASRAAPKDIGMNAIELIITVCAVLSPNTCEERHLAFSPEFSLQQCTMNAPPYIAQWVGEHPKWTAVKWRCEYPHSREKADLEMVSAG